jgi:hypothetical protein
MLARVTESAVATEPTARGWVRLRPWVRPALYWTLVPLAILLIAWQAVPLAPGPSLDPSWRAGLEMAIHNGVTFGNHLIFTYGPLGFLSFTDLWYFHLGELAFLYTVLVRLAVALALFGAARETYGSVGAFLIAAVIASVDTQLGELVALLIFGVWAIRRVEDRHTALLLAIVAGAVAGVELLIKASTGIGLAVMVGVFVLSLPNRRIVCLAAAAAAGLAALLVAWGLAGQSFGALPDYVLNSARIVLGYGAAMEYSDPTLAWQYTAVLIAFLLGLWAAWQMTDTSTSRQRVGTVALWVVFCFFAFKEAFVRQDLGHTQYFFGPALGGFVAFRWRAGRRVVGLVGIGALLAMALASQQASLTKDLDPTRDVSQAFKDLRTVASPSRRDAILVSARRQIMSADPLDAQSLSLLKGRTVAVFPWEIAAIWAYGLDWDPLPVEQSYVAYTTSLDQLDADFLASARAPQRILLQPSTSALDGRVLAFDQATTTRTMLCRYRPIRATPAFAILAPGPDRCGSPVPFGTAHAGWDQTVEVPAPPSPHALVFVRIGGVGIAGLERIVGLFWKPSIRYITLNGVRHRLVGGTASDGLPLRASAGLDYPAPFNLVPDASTISVSEDGQGPTSGGQITYSFYVERVAGFPQGDR